MFANQSSCCFIHRVEVQEGWHQPGIAIIENRTSIAVEHAIFICAQARIAARIEIAARRSCVDYRDIGRQQSVHRPFEFIQIEVAWQFECGDLAECVHAGVSTARTVHPDVAGKDSLEGGF